MGSGDFGEAESENGSTMLRVTGWEEVCCSEFKILESRERLAGSVGKA